MHSGLRSLPLFLALVLFSHKGFTHDSLEHITLHHADLAYASYQASADAARDMQDIIESLIDTPSEENLAAAKQAWVTAKDAYSLTEAFRFGHPPVDEWEPQVNAWPLDEGFIDYVEQDAYFYELSNPYGQLNLINNPEIVLGPENISTEQLSTDLLASLNEIGGSEANVATGWHAIEFLLWGQDLNGNGPGAGERPASDFALDDSCTNGNCGRRATYLAEVTQLLVDDLEYISDQWQADVAGNYRETYLGLSQTEQLRRILYAVGSLSLGELAGERMRVALFANSSEDEQDCFSDNTHHTLFYNFQGIRNVLEGNLEVGDVEVEGASIIGWLRNESPDLAARLTAALDEASAKLQVMYDAGENGTKFDQLIAPGNREGARIINESIRALVASTALIVETGEAIGLDSFTPDTAGHF